MNDLVQDTRSERRMNVLIVFGSIVHAHSPKSALILGRGEVEQRMHTFKVTGLTVLVVLLLAAGGVAAHGNDTSTTGHDDARVNGSAADWAAWMEQHMIEHLGADAAAQMQEQMGMSYQKMGEHMASHQHGSMTNGSRDGMMGGGMSGMGCH